MSLCLLAAGKLTTLAISAFTLGWTHSVERTEWQEDWRVTPAGLEIVAARVRGSGAGMEPGSDARLVDGWWVYAPRVPPLRELVLGASGATAPWSLCTDGDCMTLGANADGVLRLRPCD